LRISLSQQELVIAYEDDYIIVVDKPSGVLCASNYPDVPSLARTVFDRHHHTATATTTGHDDTNDDSRPATMDQMVVHRLGVDTSGLVVLAKTVVAVRGMNAAFRTRKVTRQYEALVCGHMGVCGGGDGGASYGTATASQQQTAPAAAASEDEGLINLPLMRDYEHPPYMRVSTDEHQRYLLSLDSNIVGRKLLEAPKVATTHYLVLAREYLVPTTATLPLSTTTDVMNEQQQQQPPPLLLPVTRLLLTSITGRTHQLNVHCAARGHPMVGDTVYGWQGQAAPYGGLPRAVLPPDAVSDAMQQAIFSSVTAARKQGVCVHARLLRFRHPVTKQLVECTSPAPF
jgi:tRNA pseudouridine32 synthase / 23S rRNA pseudouridine746 synthase